MDPMQLVFYMTLALINKNSLIVYRPEHLIRDAYMCVEFSNSGSVTSNCVWPNDWKSMSLEWTNQNRTTAVFVGNLENHRADDRTLLFYKIKYFYDNSSSMVVDSEWSSLIWNLRSYRIMYEENLKEDHGLIIFLLGLVLTQITIGGAYYSYTKYKDLN